MSRFRMQITMSLDGFVAGPDQGPDTPLGVGGMALHEWAFATRTFRAAHGGEGGEGGLDDDVLAESQRGFGAVVMGRNMFGGGPGDWGDGSWRGWWGDDPPYHAPVFVLTHHPREPLVMEGGTTFHFVTEGIEVALDRAREAAGDRDVSLGGGASAARQYIRAGLLDEIEVHVVPVLLGRGERLFGDDTGGGQAAFTVERFVSSPAAGHYRLRRAG